MTPPPKGRYQKFIVGFRPEVRARQGCMFGMRQPLDGPIFEKLEDARNWCIHNCLESSRRSLLFRLPLPRQLLRLGNLGRCHLLGENITSLSGFQLSMGCRRGCTTYGPG